MKNGLIKKMSVLALGLLAFSYVNAVANENEEIRQPFGIQPNKMHGIVMKEGTKLHDFHVEKLEAMGKDCSVCHINDDYENFLKVDRICDQDEKTAYVHENCVSCHTDLGGPQITSCRSCHNSANS